MKWEIIKMRKSITIDRHIVRSLYILGLVNGDCSRNSVTHSILLITNIVVCKIRIATLDLLMIVFTTVIQHSPSAEL